MTDYYRVGPGTLTLGTGLDEAEVSAQCSNARVTPSESVQSGDDIDLLDGSRLKGEDNVSYTFVLQGTMVQDLVATGFLAYSWEHKGEEVEFVYVPNTAREATVEGTCRIVPLEVGGAAKSRPTSDFSFPCTGADPAFTPES